MNAIEPVFRRGRLSAKGKDGSSDPTTRSPVTVRATTWAGGVLRGVVLGIAALTSGQVGSLATAQETAFPHRQHSEVTPFCTQCHSGVLENDREHFYPELERCRQCHSADEVPEDTWSDRAERGGNLRFQHGIHEELLGSTAPTCESCHVPADGPEMDVSQDIQLGTCWGCHGGADTEHTVDATCRTCHVPLAETGFSVERIQQIAAPSDHDSPSWLASEHGASATAMASRCATCHTSDVCASCHVDTDRAPITSIPAAPAGMEVPPVEVRYPTPQSHTDDQWSDLHGATASREACATCHTADDCTTCHAEPVPDAVAAMPRRSDVTAPGVGLVRRRPSSHEAPDFIDSHGALAESGGATCESCHDGAFCTQCH